jgi:hypothetical protein
MTLFTIILTVSLVLAGVLLYLGQYVSNNGDGRSEVVRSGPEEFRFLWHRFRRTVAEMNYAARRMVEVQTPPHPSH